LDLDPSRKFALVGSVLAIEAIRFETSIGAHLLVQGNVPLCETPLLGHNDLLATRELKLGSSQRLDDVLGVGLLDTHGHHDLIDVHTGDRAKRLAISTTHSSLEPISPSAAQHLVNTQHVKRVQPNSHVESILAARLDQVLVGANASGLQSFRAYLFVLSRHQMYAGRKFVHAGLLATQVIDADLRVRHTTTEARFRVRLVLAVAITASWSSSHG